ncbi:hypothetical protein HYFRA_00002776 [Hymenoscyphus fraxineus]|uniref:Uncharacterized protein n=1 Tax=Hymenoscyphus fraxineus TaxID=746836 RepID=A0A9N9KR75_9HELO|nr:hypothetical protein HYFRA_00002776 [Hymenoscyphus fraxineus]
MRIELNMRIEVCLNYPCIEPSAQVKERNKSKSSSGCHRGQRVHALERVPCILGAAITTDSFAGPRGSHCSLLLSMPALIASHYGDIVCSLGSSVVVANPTLFKLRSQVFPGTEETALIIIVHAFVLHGNSYQSLLSFCDFEVEKVKLADIAGLY